MKSKMDCRTLNNAKNTSTNASIGGLASGNNTSDLYDVYEMRDEQSSSGNTKLAIGLLAGASVGILAGMLLAPERGRVLRTQVANSASTLGNQVTKSASTLGSQVTKSVDFCKETVNSWTGKSKAKSSNTNPVLVEDHLAMGGEPVVVDPARNNPRYF